MIETTKKAGAIIFRETSNGLEFLLIFRNFRGDWTFPKGHVDPGEDFETTMRREVMEETGLEVEVKKQLPDMYYQTPNRGYVEVKYYLATPRIASTEARPEYRLDKVEWVLKQDVEKKLTYDNLKKYFKNLENEF